MSLGIILFFLTLHAALRGMNWDVGVHPDEIAISRFQHTISQTGYLTHRAYPTGWFRLYGIKESIRRPWNTHVESFKKKHLAQDDHYRPPAPPPVEYDFIPYGRSFNGVLLALSSVLLYAALLQAHLHPLAAFAGATFLGIHPISIEFAHYCESDIALVFSFSLFAFFCTRTLARNSWLSYAIAMFVLGFAISCKFTLTPLALLCPILAATLAWNASGSLTRKILLFLASFLIGLLLIVLGLAYGMPILIHDFPLFQKLARHTSRRTYGEISYTLDSLKDTPWVREIFKLGGLIRGFSFLGRLPTVLLVASIPIVLQKTYRKQALGIPLFLLIFLPFSIFYLPFFRRQEILPVLVAMAYLFGFFADYAIRHLRLPCHPATRAFACSSIVLLLLLLGSTSMTSRRMGETFQRRDSLTESRSFLESSASPNVNIVYGTRLSALDRGLSLQTSSKLHVAFEYPAFRDTFSNQDHLYYLHNASYRGRRPFYEIFSGKYLPHIQASIDQFQAENIRLSSWALLPGRIRPIFSQPDIELWYLKGCAPTQEEHNLPLFYPRPIAALPHTANPRIPHTTSFYGPNHAIRLACYSSHLFRSNTQDPSWIVVQYLSGDHPILLSSSKNTSPRKQTLLPGQTTVLHILPTKSPFLTQSSALQEIKLRAKKLTPSDLCIASVCSDPAEVAYLLRTSGNPREALDFLDTHSTSSEECDLQRILAQKECSLPLSESDSLLLAQYRPLLQNPSSASAIARVPTPVAKDFAFLRDSLSSRSIILPKGTCNATLHFSAPIDDALLQQPLFSIPHSSLQKTSSNELHVAFSLPQPSLLTWTPEPSPILDSFESLELQWDPFEFLSDDIAQLQAL